MKRQRLILPIGLGLLLAGAVQSSAVALPIDVTLPGKPTVVTSGGLTSFLLPTGPFANGLQPGMRLEGELEQLAWRVDVPGQTTLELLTPLRSALRAAGFSLIYECDDTDCGGFDFRYALDVIPEPEMHVDLGDFRFVSALRQGDGVTILVSRSADAGFVQIASLSGGRGAGSTVALAPAPSQPAVTTAPRSGGFGVAAALEAEGHAALDDLEFASGTSALSEGAYASLFELADWLRANSEKRVALVGHTDAAGGLDANTALSKKRAEAVRERLMTVHKIPADQLEAVGVGYLSPRATNQTEDGRRKNRRVEAVVTSTPAAP